MAKSKRLAIPKPVNGYGYVGVWQFPKNTLGWMMADHVSGPYDRISPDHSSRAPEGARLFLCEIIVKPVLNKNGSPITKIIRKKKQ